jgi:hypothetical protein
MMTKHKKIFVLLLVALISMASLISPSYAATMSITVPLGEEVDQKIDLQEDDHILIQISVVGTKNNFISLFITYPNRTERNFGDIATFEQKFVSDIEGEYTLSFVNTDITERKLVTLNYKIDRYVFGMPELFFQALVIALICLAMIAVFIKLTPSM